MHTELLKTRCFRIYAQDTIPLWSLSSKRTLGHIGKTFGFEQFQFVQPEGEPGPPNLVFERGRAPAAEPAAPAVIETLRIGQEQLDLTMRAAEGHAFGPALLAELNRVCAEIVPARAGWIEKFRVEMFQTVWVGQLDLAPEDLIDPRARGLLLPTLATDSGQGVRQVYARGLSLRLATLVPKPELLELGIQSSDDEFKLEPRAGRPPSERAWFSASPLRSEDHLQLLENIERAYRS